MYQVVSIVTYLPIILSVKKIYFILTYASTNLYTLVIYKSMPIVLFWVPREQGRSAVVSLYAEYICFIMIGLLPLFQIKHCRELFYLYIGF